jgi:hypothetical protein
MASKTGKPLIIVHHAKCIDGAACAWCVAKAHGVDTPEGRKGRDVTFIAYAHHERKEAEEQIRAALKTGALLYFVDVAPSREFLDELMTPGKDGQAKVESISVMDHHETETRALKNYFPPTVEGSQPGLNIVLDPNVHSAARMVWSEMLPDEKAPPVLDVINMMDGDAKGLTTPDAFAAAAYIDMQDIGTTAKAFDTLRGLASQTFNEMAADGRHLATDQKSRIDKMMENAAVMELQILPGQPPQKVAIVNADVKQYGRQISEVLTAAGQEAGSGVALAWYAQKNGAVTMSIRTNGDPDASLICEHLRNTMGCTGGGHDGAGAVHFKSIFEFARHMPFGEAMIKGREPAAKSTPISPQPPQKFLH